MARVRATSITKFRLRPDTGDGYPGRMYWLGDAQLSRQPYPLPTMTLNPAVTDLFAFQYGDFTLENYQAHAGIKAPIAV